MSERLLEIRTRREVLVAECAAQRALLAECWRTFDRPAAACQRAAGILRSPWLWAGIALVAFKLPKAKLLRMAMLAWKGTRLLRRAQALVHYRPV